MPDMVLKKFLRPALMRASITGKVIGWHSFRHSLATNLRSLGVDVKTAQELLRHANSRTAMDIYTQAMSPEKRRGAHARCEDVSERSGRMKTSYWTLNDLSFLGPIP